VTRASPSVDCGAAAHKTSAVARRRLALTRRLPVITADTDSTHARAVRGRECRRDPWLEGRSFMRGCRMHRWALACLAVSSLAVSLACSTTKTKGQLMVSVQTDMELPKDVDRI